MHPLRPIEDFADPLRALVDEGIPFAVIGGCAVGCYARLLGMTVLSTDLDICVPDSGMQDVLALALRHGAAIISRPQPRGIPVAFIDWRGRELNVLTGAKGLPDRRSVRHPGEHARDPETKDLPHIEVLERFIEEEVVATMGGSGHVRDRISAARKLLDVLGAATLPESLGERLVGLGDSPPIRRFLVGRLATRAQAERVVAAAPEAERAELEAILEHRAW